MKPDDRFAQAWADIPDPMGAVPARSSRPVAAPTAPSPTRAAMKKRRLIALGAVLPWSALVLLRWGARPGLGQLASMVAGQTLLFGALVAVAVVIAISSGRRGLGRPASRARMVAIGAPIVFAVVGLFWLPSGAPGTFGELGPIEMIWPCVWIGVLVAAPLLMGAVWALERTLPSAAGSRGAALGAATGLVGAIVLTIHCGSPLGGHVALAHGMPIVIGAVLGALLGVKRARA